MQSSHHKRSIKAVWKALFNPGNYAGLAKLFLNCSNPIDFLARYLRNSGDYPATFRIRTPVGPVSLTAYGPDDLLTINEIFFRGDYCDDRGSTAVVDFGSNIGISAVYFLSRNREAFVHCFEPVEQNVERLRKHLGQFEGRFEIQEVAVAESDGMVEFGWEPTGRYGGIGRSGVKTIKVPARDSNAVLSDIVDRHGRIDLLKIDIEGLEEAIVDRLPEDLASKIGLILAEGRFAGRPLGRTHQFSYRRPITMFSRRSDRQQGGQGHD